jgi:hypothetical protein
MIEIPLHKKGNLHFLTFLFLHTLTYSEYLNGILFDSLRKLSGYSIFSTSVLKLMKTANFKMPFPAQ